MVANAIDDRSWELQQEDIAGELEWLENVESEFNAGEWIVEWAEKQVGGMHLRMEITELEGMLADAGLALKEALVKYADYEKKLARKGRTIKDLRAQLADARRAATQASRSELKRQLKGQRAESGTLLVEVSRLRCDLAAANGQLARERARSPTNYAIVKKENEHLVAVVRKLTGENKRLLDHIENLSGQDS